MLQGKTLSERYLLADVIGRGGMGIVYRAQDLVERRPVAVKILRAELMDSPPIIERFQREATIATALRHPNVVGVLDHGRHGSARYMVMELVAGDALTMLMDAPMAGRDFITIVTQILAGLAHAHAAGLIHRDLKPDNIVIEHREGGIHATIVDFGIAIRNADVAGPRIDRLTGLDETLGTPEFMAPEQARGEAIDHRADIFSLGLISYALLAGIMPFDGSGLRVTLANMTTPVPPIGTRAAVVVDPLLEAFTRWLLEKEPGERPSSALYALRTLELVADDRRAAERLLASHWPCASLDDAAPPPVRSAPHRAHPRTISRITRA